MPLLAVTRLTANLVGRSWPLAIAGEFTDTAVIPPGLAAAPGVDGIEASYVRPDTPRPRGPWRTPRPPR